jgi:hypothetical protein
MMRAPSAFWIDTKAKIEGPGLGTLGGILEDADSQPKPPLCVFILCAHRGGHSDFEARRGSARLGETRRGGLRRPVRWTALRTAATLSVRYDLPHRDCNAKASAGEIGGAHDAALEEYKTQYVLPFAQTLRRYHARVPVVVVLEPDSLGNAVASDGSSCTQATLATYRAGIRYAVETIAREAPSVAMYVDAGHGGWLGYEQNAARYAQLIGELNIIPCDGGRSMFSE